MEQAIAKAQTLIEALGYIQRFAGKTVVIKMGGAVMDRLLQPHESHTNYVLQFMMDYNLQGMNTVNRSQVLCVSL